MDEIKLFRGIAGETTLALLSPWTFFAAIPVGVFFFVLALLIGFTGLAQNALVATGIFMVASGFIVGRIGLSAMRGKPDAGLLDSSVSHGEAFAYSIRYAVLILIWGLPVSLILWLVIGGSGRGGLLLMGMGMGMVSMGFKGALVVILILFSMFASIASYIIALRADNLGELFSPEPWFWIVQSRLGDFFVLLGALAGGLVVFYFVYSIPSIVVIISAFAMHPALGAFIMGLIYVALVAVGAIHLGRLSGVFIAYEGSVSNDLADTGGSGLVQAATSEVTAKKENQPVPETPVPVVAPTFSLEETVARVRTLPADQLESTAKKLVEDVKNGPTNIGASVELTLVYKKMDKTQEMFDEAAQALGLLMAMGNMDIAEKLFTGLGKDRMRTPLVGEDKKRLGQYLVDQGKFLEGGVLLYSGMAGDDAALAEKKVMETARAAETGGKPKEALVLYQQILKKHPDSNFADFIRDAIKNLQNSPE
jgi:hypothetical protein